MSQTPPLLLVLSGPSGVGKDAVLQGMKTRGLPFYWVVTVTTRKRRLQEHEGVDYHFLPTERFERMRESGELLEYARVYDHWYGVPLAAVRQALTEGRDTLLKIDVQGATTIKDRVPEAVLVFLSPPTTEDLMARLRQRRTESAQQLALRLQKAQDEMGRTHMFDYQVVNDQVEAAIDRILAIITAEKCRTHPRRVRL
ncbi:MAG: guanylate kinase [Dehalococcoidia bacterium]|nr:guanylate kinase [Dehalococcoidia bacterium]